MNHDRSVAEEGPDCWLGRGIEIEIVCDKMIATTHIGDATMLTAQVANLTGFRIGGITRRILTTNERIEMSKSFRAISIGWKGLVMDVIY